MTTFKTSASNLEQIPRVPRATVLALTSTAPWPLRRKQGLLPIARIDVIDAIALRGMRLRWKEVELAVQGRMHSALTSLVGVWHQLKPDNHYGKPVPPCSQWLEPKNSE